MDSIKGVLSEELDNSERILNRYRRELDALPKGSLVAKRIKSGIFYYVASRRDGKVRFEYRGKLSAEEVEKIRNNMKLRARYRAEVVKVKKQIAFLRRALHERKRRKVRPS